LGILSVSIIISIDLVKVKTIELNCIELFQYFEIPPCFKTKEVLNR